ncbi:hypothetical protein NB037_02460 [Rathayibacter sp. ZW T2_19]|uniref:Uncharacterized protein n=1 Tax=Rathayibacter rubneri TaxID=2950106 RepID=A0A9X2DV26_9MICO|nr:hypothetical protein [Rathayibacter rubneri]MCM6761272.1 hypothetical protein [Rathayibacter rubneri]
MMDLSARPNGSPTFNGDAWSLTRRLSPRDTVRTMRRDAYGRLDENAYPTAFRVSPVAPSTPWAIYLADDAGVFRLLCFDFDGKDSHGVDPDLMEQAADDCDALSVVLDAHQVAHVVCESSGTGGRHLWVGVRGGAAAAEVDRLAIAAKANFSTLDHGMLHNPRTGAARPPQSPHRDGSVSRILRGRVEDLLDPIVLPASLVAVAAALEATPSGRRYFAPTQGAVVSQHRTHRALSAAGAAHMATADGGANPSWTAFMCLLSAAHAGWTMTDVEHAAQTAPGMEHYRTKNTGRGSRRPRARHEAADRLGRQWEKALQFAALHAVLPSPREPRDLTELEGIVAAVSNLLERFRAHPGRWGRTERATSERTILTALAYLTLHTGKRTVAASVRDLALLSGLGRTTAASALRTLREDGYVQLVARADGSNASEWRLTGTFSTTPSTVRTQPFNNPRPPGQVFSERAVFLDLLEKDLTDARHDLFTRSGLGHLAGKVYALLGREASVTVDSTARMLGVTARTAATSLSRLRSHRLIVKHIDGWRRSLRDLRTTAARVLGVDGLLEDRAYRYGIEREVWAWWQAELAYRSSAPRERPRRPHVTSRPLFEDSSSGERVWPLYPRDAAGRGDHREALHWGRTGMLAPGSLWWSSVAA